MSRLVVVACLLAFLAHLRTGNPQNRIEPVDAANYFGRRLKQPVAPENMRDLVREDDTNPIVGPRSSVRGQDDPRTPDSPCHEQCRPLALEEDRRPCEPMPTRDVLGYADPWPGNHASRAGFEPPQAAHTDD